MKTKLFLALAALGVATVSANAAAEVRITEKMYTGLFGEFVEITNIGNASQSLSGWNYTDSSNTNVSLTSVGTLDAGESAIITEVDTDIFDLVWFGTYTGKTKPAGLVIVENVTVNLGRNDLVKIKDNLGATKDILTYNDQGAGTVDGVRSEEFSAIPGSGTVFGTDNFSSWILSVVGTGAAWKSGNNAASANGCVGSPGTYPN